MEKKNPCRRKWKHEHISQKTIRVFSRPGYGTPKNFQANAEGKARFVDINDDGSICDKYTPKPVVFVPESWTKRVERADAQIQR